ncbi:efflux RND transporter periplasmic adaptor subunit [Fontivita pretiosa]|uniref:efflux RND transporter periplasmic adaptor subunit n=1 Tax=Fontivita pretiosa TaxID=2989684 RepID=UPI003D179E28
MKSPTNIVLLLLITLSPALSGCGDREGRGQARAQQPSAAQSDPIAVQVAPVRVGPLERIVEVVGTLWGDEHVTLGAKVPGRVRDIFVDVGDRVAPAQPLAQIDPTDYELAVEQKQMELKEALAKLGLSELPDSEFDVATVATVERAKFQAANARARLERARVLFQAKPPLISEQDYADLETAYEVAQRDHAVAELEARSQLALARSRQSELAAAQQRLADTMVRAPTAPAHHSNSTPSSTASTQPGLVVPWAVAQRRAAIGAYVREGEAMFDLVADDPIRFRAAVPERFLAELKLGQPVHVRVESYPQTFQGQVARINPAINVSSRSFEIEANVPNPQRLLRPGAFARGTVITGQDANVIFVPRRAVISFAGVDRVFTVGPDSQAVEHVVELGPQEHDYVALRAGLDDPNAKVIVAGHQRLAGGQRVLVQSPTTADASPP